MKLPNLGNVNIALLGLGYVGLPLAVEFAKRYDVLGFDINTVRVDELRKGIDRTREVTSKCIINSARLKFTSRAEELAKCNIYIVTVPTPIDIHRVPDLRPLFSASETVGKVIQPGDLVIYESTVYPGATEDDCVPIIEHRSGLICNHDFTVGYSPERVNPGDEVHRIPDIVKVTSGSTPEAADLVDRLYASIIIAGTHRAPSIRVAEMAKIIENTQRDVNIALINELSMLFHRLKLDTDAVLAAASTKWNFLPFRPGLVGGHCIGVDPYYLTYKAQSVGHHPEMILAGRRTNDRMGIYVAERIIRVMTKKRIHIVDSRVLVLGATFKENCPDLRNSQVVSLVKELKNLHLKVHIHDPWADPEEVELEFGLKPVEDLKNDTFDAIILAVAHREYLEMEEESILNLGNDPCVIYDVKSVLQKSIVDESL